MLPMAQRSSLDTWLRTQAARPLKALVAARSTDTNIRYVRAVRRRDASGLVADVYEQMEAEAGLLPPFTVYSPEPRLLAAAWSAGRESWLAGPFDSALREAVAASVSNANSCPYCLDAHTMMLSGAGHGGTAAALRTGERRVRRTHVDAVVEWAEATGEPGSDILAEPPFGPGELPAAIAVAVFFHMTNRVANVLLSESALPVPMPGPLRSVALGIAGATVGAEITARELPYGRSLGLGPKSDQGQRVPQDMAWASSLPAVAAANARLAYVTDDLVSDVLSAATVELVEKRIAGWEGGSPGFGKAWLTQACSDLDAQETPTARLALLTALASHQVTDEDVDAFRSVQPGDAALVTVVAWAAFGAARRIGTWLTP